MITEKRFATVYDSLDRLPYFTPDRKSTRLNSSHQIISYAVFCLKKKKKNTKPKQTKTNNSKSNPNQII